MKLLKAKTKSKLLDLIREFPDIFSANEYLNMMAEVEALETEKEPIFNQGDVILVFNGINEIKVVYSNMEGGSYVDSKGKAWPLANRITEWLEYKGVKPKLPENAKGWHLKYEDGELCSVEKNEDIAWKGYKNIIEYQFWLL